MLHRSINSTHDPLSSPYESQLQSDRNCEIQARLEFPFPWRFRIAIITWAVASHLVYSDDDDHRKRGQLQYVLLLQ